MSMFDIFKSNDAAPYVAPTEQAQAQPAPTTPPVAAEPGNIPPVDPAAQPPAGVPAVAVVPDSPLAEFSKLWDTKPVDPNAPNTTPTPLDAAAVQQAVAKTDFSQVITPETLAAIVAGGEGAEAAFAQAINMSSQKVMADSINVNNKLMEKAIKDALAGQQVQMQEQIRQQAAANHLKDTNPLFNDPAVKPVIEAAQSALMRQFPSATPEELTTMTNNYIQTMGKAFAPAAVTNDNGAAGTDWDKFMQP